MHSCPNCQFELNDEAVASGLCPQCNVGLRFEDGEVIRTGKDSVGTLDDIEVPGSFADSPEPSDAKNSRTIDSGDDFNTTRKAETIDDDVLEQQAAEKSNEGPGALGRTIDESLLDSVDSSSIEGIGQTIEATSPPPEINQTIDESMLDSIDSDSVDGLDQPLPSHDQTVENVSVDPSAGIDQTIDSTEFPVPIGNQTLGDVSDPPDQSSKTIDDTKIAQTIDSVDIDPNIAKTVESGDDFSVSDVNQEDAGKTVAKTVDSADFGTPPAGGGIDMTVDSGEFGAGPHGPTVGQTVDSVDGISPDAATGRGTVPEGDSDIVKTLDSIWGDEVQDALPQMTVKGVSDKRTVTSGNLVIQSRAVSTKSNKGKKSDYELISQLGEGGMGVVYSARQASIDRKVAIKMLKKRTVKDEVQRAKFLSEAVVTGELDHPNIVPIYDLGTDNDGALFYSMKEVQGVPWMQRLENKDISTSENIDVLLKVADAIAFAHSRGVIHRDLKPENIMLGEFGEVLVMDWGLAVATDEFRKQGVSRAVSMGGTPAYMAPEMAAGTLDRIGKHSDIYLLGAILYEIITGQFPHTGKDTMKCLFAAAKNHIQPTKKKGELVDIANKAMATEPEDRYESVQDFQAAIRLYQEHSESIVLSTHAGEQLEKAKASDDYTGFSQAVFGFQEAYNLWNQNTIARSGITEAKLAYAKSAHRKGDFDLGLSLLDEDTEEHTLLRSEIEAAQTQRSQQEQRNRALKKAVVAIVGVFAIIVSSLLVVVWFQKADIAAKKEDADKARDVAINQRKEADRQRGIADTERKRAVNNETLAVKRKVEADKQRNIAVMERTEADKQRKKAVAAEVVAVAAKKVAEENERTAKRERKKADAATKRAVLAQNEEKKARIAADEAKEKEEYAAYIARIGLAAAKIEENAFGQARNVLDQCKKELRNWEWGRLRHLCDQSITELVVGSRVDSVDVDRQGTRCITGSRDGRAIVWDLKSGKQLDQVTISNSIVSAVALSPTQNVAALGTNDRQGYLQLWNLQTKKRVVLKGHSDTVASVQFSRDGKRLLTASHDKKAIIWNVSNGQPMHVLQGHTWWVYSAQFSADEKQVVTCSRDGTVLAWNLANQKNKTIVRPVPFTGHSGPVYTATFSPDGKWIASGGYDKRILLWQPKNLKSFDYEKLIQDEKVPATPFTELKGHSAAIRKLQFDSSGARLISGSHDNSMKVWFAREAITPSGRVRAGTLAKTLRGHDSLVRDCSLFAGDKRAISGSYDGRVKIWDIGSYEEQRMFPGHVLAGHADAVLYASFSRDGKHIATASRDRTAKKWDVRSGAELRSFREGHSFLVSQGIFFDNGKKLLTAAVDNSARVWNVHTGSQILELRGTGRGASAGISADGKWIVTGSDEVKRGIRTIKVWDAKSGKVAKKLAGHRGVLTMVAFDPQGKKLLTGDSKGRTLLWNTSDWTSQRLPWHTSRVNSAVFLPDGKSALTASDDRTLCYWDLSNPNKPTPLAARNFKHKDAVTSVAISKDSKRVLTSCEDDVVRCWRIDRPQKPLWEHKWDLDKSDIRNVAISSDGDRALAVDSRKHVVHLLSMKDGIEIKVPSGNGQSGSLLDLKSRAVVWSATFSPDGQGVLTVGGNQARLWDLQGKEHMSFSPHRAVAAVSFSPNGKWIVTASWDNTARIWDAATGEPKLKLGRAVAGAQGAHSGSVNSAMFSADGGQILTASSDSTIKIWNATTGKVLKTFSGHKGPVRSAIFSPDGAKVLSASDDNTARFWSIATTKQIGQFVGHSLGVTSAHFSPKADRIITASEDNSAIIWNATTGKRIFKLDGHTASVTSAVFSPDGRRVLTGCDDFTAKLWDSETAEEILTLKGHTQAVTSVSFSQNGRDVLTSSRDGTAILWLTSQWKAAAASE